MPSYHTCVINHPGQPRFHINPKEPMLPRCAAIEAYKKLLQQDFVFGCVIIEVDGYTADGAEDFKMKAPERYVVHHTTRTERDYFAERVERGVW